MTPVSLTRQVPGIGTTNVEVRDDGGGEGAVIDLSPQVLKDELLVGGMEAEPGRQPQHTILDKIEPLHNTT